MPKKFSNWVRWADRNDLPNIKCPGIYAIAISKKNMNGLPFHFRNNLREEIRYFGMTNAEGGLKSRLKQFDNTINGGTGHGGAQRFYYRYSVQKKWTYLDLIRQLFVSVSHTACDLNSRSPVALRLMGDVERQENWCKADYVETFGELPEFNDKDRSPKK